MQNIYLNYFLIGFQDPATPIMEGIIDLHNYIFLFLVIVLTFVVTMLVAIVYYFHYKIHFAANNLDVVHRYSVFLGNQVTHGTVLEIVWTLVPSLILMAVAVPSFALLYSMDEVTIPTIYLKVIGHQWYWSYEYASFKNTYFYHQELEKISPKAFELAPFDSYMLSENDLQKGQLRLLETDKVLHLPSHTHIRVLVTAMDVLHSWAVPSLGIKVDAVPGRLSQVNAYIKRDGIFYGQCSEICGVNHGFMPISVKVMPIAEFTGWVANQLVLSKSN